MASPTNPKQCNLLVLNTSEVSEPAHRQVREVLAQDPGARKKLLLDSARLLYRRAMSRCPGSSLALHDSRQSRFHNFLIFASFEIGAGVNRVLPCPSCRRKDRVQSARVGALVCHARIERHFEFSRVSLDLVWRKSVETVTGACGPSVAICVSFADTTSLPLARPLERLISHLISKP